MITTICLNPAFDRTVTLAALRPGEVHRAVSARSDAGGKGINVALVLKNLGAQTQCLWCAPEEDAAQMASRLDRYGLCHCPMPVPGAIRTNLKLVAPEGTTDINESGARMDEDTLRAVLEACVVRSAGSSITVLTGSLPPGCPRGTDRELLRRLTTPAVLDVSGEELLLGLAARPFLVKPNREELGKSLDIPVDTTAQVLSGAKALREMGAQNVLVSLGGDGALLLTEGHAWLAPALEVSVRSTVGAGDAMVAGMLYGYEKTGSLREAFPYGVAAGSAAVMMEGTQPFARETFDALLRQVLVQEVPV